MLCRRVQNISTLILFFPCFSRKINTRKAPARRVEENEVQEEIPPHVEEGEQGSHCSQGDQVPIDGGGNDLRR